MKWSPMTLLRLVRQRPLPASAHMRVIGGDEWAWRKGQRDGTILVDLENHLPIDLLADVKCVTIAQEDKFVGEVHPGKVL